MLKRLVCWVFILLLPINNINARFRTIDDSDFTYDFYNIDTVINQDGSSENIIEFQITILREQARTLAAKFPISYNSDSSSINIIEAKTIFNENQYPVTKDMIEDKSVGVNIPGFDDQKQIAISFPRSEVGAKIYLKYKEHITKTPIEKEFSENYFFGTEGGYWKEANLTISSAIDLQIKKNDPYGALEVVTENIKGKNHFRKARIKLIKPITTSTINEVDDSSLNPELFTYISISSIDSWEKFGSHLATKYIEIQNQIMPELFATLSKDVAQQKDIVSQINLISSKLNEKIQYFGTWQSHKGKFIPQDLALVASKQTGDCKDFATIAVKILKELGYQANVALVRRGVGDRELTNILPNGSAFNHAIVKVIDKNGKIYWIDPTNIVSMADGIFPDIAGKYALVLDSTKSTYEKIPDISEMHAQILVTNLINLDNTINLKLQFLGEEALRLSGIGLYLSKKGVEDILYSNFILNNVEENNRGVSIIPDLSKRIVEPIAISLEYKSNDIWFKTNLGKGYRLSNNESLLGNIARVDLLTNVNDLYLGYPRTLERRTIIAKTKVANSSNLNLDVQNPFISLQRKCYIAGEDTIIVEKIIIHKSWIANKEFNSKEFRDLQNIIKNQVINSGVILP